MSKRNKRRGKSNGVKTQAAVSGVQAAPLAPSLGGQIAGNDPWRKTRWLIFSLLSTAALVIVFAILFSETSVREWFVRERPIKGKRLPEEDPLWGPLKAQAERRPKQQKWKIEPWQPVSEDDKFLDRFVTLHQKFDPKAFELLAPLRNDAGPVSEEEADRRAAGTYLRDKDVRVLDVWRGEPDSQGKPRPAARRFTLVTKGSMFLDIPVRSGRLTNAVVVVEMTGSGDIRQIRPLRPDVNAAP